MFKYIWIFFITSFLACNNMVESDSSENALIEKLDNAKKKNAKLINLEATVKTLFVLDESIKYVKDVNEYKEYLYRFDIFD